MLDVLEFIFSSFWVWLGTMFLIESAAGGVTRALNSLLTILKRY